MKNYFFIAGLFLLESCGSPGRKAESQEMAVCISDSSRSAASVYLTSDENNIPVISWTETDTAGKKYFYLSFFDTAGKKFLPGINIPIEQNASLHEEGMPKLAVKEDGSIIAMYETSSPTKENQWAGNVYYMQSFDKGKSWSRPRFVHADTAEGKSRSFASITRLSNGEIGACWLDAAFDYKRGGRSVKFASTKGDKGFQNEILIDSMACECCRTAISSDDKGNISIVFRDIIKDSIRDMSFSSSGNNGQSFSRPVSFSGDNWNINGCPHNGPGVVRVGDVTYATWFTGGHQRGVYYGELSDGKTMIHKQLVSAQGRFIQLCLLPNGNPVLAYNENVQDGDNVYSKIVLNKIEKGKTWASDINTGRSMASYPVIRSFGDNRIVVAWTSDENVYYAITNTANIIAEIKRPSVADIPIAMDFSHIKLAGTTDLVCGMSLSLSPGDTTLFNDRVYGFCSETCKERFLSKPAAFVQK